MRASIGNLKPDGVPVPAIAASRWRTAFWTAWTALLIAKIALAASLAPFGDEAWYWQESGHLAAGYSDLPPMTACLIRLGETVFGHGVLAMRATFLMLGALLPLVIVRMARRVFDETAGWCAGLLALGLPLLGTLGLFALPDVPLTFAGALALDAGERATRSPYARNWALLGLALALAWLSHYRAAMLMFTGLAFFSVTTRGRALWRRPALWLALVIALLGLIPTLWFNARHDWVGFGFQLVERHPWTFHVDALVQPVEQALVCTPLFYLLLLWAMWQVLRRARAGAPWDLLAVCAIVPIAAYFVFGCFADDIRFRAHWPLPGYLPLLIALPVLMRESFVTRRLRVIACVTFAMLAFGNLIAYAYLVLAAVPGGAAALAHVKAFPEHWVGWSESAQQTRALLAQPRFRDAVLVADNFMLAAELDFALNGELPVYALDQPINAKHGRAAQLAIWQRDETALRVLGPHEVLLIAEPTARRERERATWMQSLCVRVADLAPVASLDLYDGRKHFRWFSGAIPSSDIATASDCPAKP
jgi:4-amino-4-deoxy-L-arabinose transferase-like glycosyltransferase